LWSTPLPVCPIWSFAFDHELWFGYDGSGAGGDGTTSTQQAGVQASPVEASQSTTTPNPFEALKDEQS